MSKRQEEIYNASSDYVEKKHSPAINDFQIAMKIAAAKAFVEGAKYADKSRIDAEFQWFICNILKYINVGSLGENGACQITLQISKLYEDFYKLHEFNSSEKSNDNTYGKMVNLKKICEWIKEHDMTKHISTLYSGVCTINFNNDSLIDDLCKAMEE